jgi:hypothetical protein
MANYPLSGDKIDALRESMRETGMWPNIMARMVGTTAEIAYGHHRLAAAMAEFGEDHEVGVVVDKIDDIGMLRLMARENLETYTTEFRSLLETWEAAVIAASNGVLDTSKAVKSRSPAEYSLNHDSTFRYNVDFIARILGWVTKSRVSNAATAAAAALELIGQGHMAREDFNGLSVRDAMNLTVLSREKMRQIAEATDRVVARPNIEPARREAIKKEAKKQIDRVGMIAKHVAGDTAKGKIPSAGLRAEVLKRVFSTREARDLLVDEFVKQTTRKIEGFFAAESNMSNRLSDVMMLMPEMEEVDRREVEKLELALDNMSADASANSKALYRARTTPTNVVNLKAIEGGNHE